MNIGKRSDQVFQLSLTEIAFTIAFILLLLLGYLVMRESEAKKQAESELAKVQDLTAAQIAIEQASSRLKKSLASAGVTNPDEVISRLVTESSAASERDRLHMQVKNLEAQISALSEVKQMVSEVTKQLGRTETADRIVSALALQAEAEAAVKAVKEVSASKGGGGQVNAKPSAEQTRTEVQRSIQVAGAVDRALRDAGAKPLPKGNEAEAVAGMVKETADLRGQMANMRNRFNAVGKGLDHPPCWADEAGNIEYIFSVELRSGVINIMPAWPERRRADAEKIPGVTELISTPLNVERFRFLSRPILDISKRQDPECRHFVHLINSIESRREADQARWMVEEFFYKREARK